jgi:hypothetical protein
MAQSEVYISRIHCPSVATEKIAGSLSPVPCHKNFTKIIVASASASRYYPHTRDIGLYENSLGGV